MTPDEVADWAIKEDADYKDPKIVALPLGDIKSPPEFYQVDTETSYRRGFMQGMAYAVELISDLYRKGYNRPTEIANIIEDFNLSTLGPWRGRVADDVHAGEKRGEHPMFGHPVLRQEKWDSIRQRILRRDNGKCRICGDVVKVQVDHIFSVQRGGLPTDDNLQTLCLGCHVKKTSKG